MGDEAERIVGFDEVPEAATDRPVELAPLVTTGVGAELIEESTVRCGFAVNEGGMYCPVG